MALNTFLELAWPNRRRDPPPLDTGARDGCILASSSTNGVDIVGAVPPTSMRVLRPYLFSGRTGHTVGLGVGYFSEGTSDTSAETAEGSNS